MSRAGRDGLMAEYRRTTASAVERAAPAASQASAVEAHSAAILTIGHSNKPFDEFLGLLMAHRVTLVVDVRTMPGSRHNPQFNRESLARSLPEAGISYVHLPGLGGRRRRQKDSPNSGWNNASFQGYADYMLTPEFEQNL